MGLIKLHVAFSILCILTFVGLAKLCKETIVKNGWISREKKNNILNWLYFFVPIMNVIIIVALFVMIGMNKEDYEKERNKR